MTRAELDFVERVPGMLRGIEIANSGIEEQLQELNATMKVIAESLEKIATNMG